MLGQHPEAENELGAWMRDERDAAHTLSRRAIAAQFKAILRARDAVAADRFLYSKRWFAACMRRLGFSWRLTTRRASTTKAARLPRMVQYVSDLSARVARVARKEAARRQEQRASVEFERVLGGSAPPLYAEARIKRAREVHSDEFEAFYDLDTMQKIARGEVGHHFGVPPAQRFNVDQVPVHAGYNSRYTWAVRGSNSVETTARHGAHKVSFEFAMASLAILLNCAISGFARYDVECDDQRLGLRRPAATAHAHSTRRRHAHEKARAPSLRRVGGGRQSAHYLAKEGLGRR